MDEIIRVDEIHQYNQLMGVETLHPLVGMIDFSKIEPIRNSRKLYGFYAVFLKGVCGEIKYGHSRYDYQDGTMLFVAPGQVMGAADDGEFFQPTGYLLMFHPDLLHGTPLGKMIKEYTFFSYESNEALHLSEKERSIILNSFDQIRSELAHPIDKHSKPLLVDNIKLLLDYCTRFYDRQFISRETVNKDVLVRLENLLNDYFTSDKPEKTGVPTVQYCADELNLSANYLSDLIRKETGSTALKLIHARLMEEAKYIISTTDRNVSEIAYALGFQYPQHFTRFFKQNVGCTPNEYRTQIKENFAGN